MKKVLIVFLIMLIGSLILPTPQGYSQGTKIIGKVVSKAIVKKNAKRIVNGGKIIDKSIRLINYGLKANAKRTIKNKGYKSFLAFSSGESRELLSCGKVSINRAGLNKNFKSRYANAISKTVSVGASPKRIMASAVAQTIPVGVKAIKTKWDRNKKGYVPALDAGHLSPNAAKRLLTERRKAVSPYNQFATKDQLDKYDSSLIELGKEKDATVLKRNMFKVMDPNVEKQINAFGGVAAHHVVPGNDPHAKGAREILKKYKIDINSPENGIFLPTDKNSIYKGVIHNTNHSPKYSKYVYNQLKECKSKDEVISALDKIKHDLYNGKLYLKDDLNVVNTNVN